MIQLTVLYGKPVDQAAFDRHYREVHAPLARKLPGLRGYTSSTPKPRDPGQESPHYLIANLYFDDMASLETAFASPESDAADRDLQNFATGGVTSVIGKLAVYTPLTIDGA